MKVIIPIAGTGLRMRPMTLNTPKCLLPIAGGTILGHILAKLEHLSISEYIFVVGYLGKNVENYISTEYPHITAKFVWQNKPQGLGEAINLCGEHLTDNEPVLIILGDTLFEANFSSLKSLSGNVLYVREVEDPRRFGVAKTDKDGKVEVLVEKPQEFVSNKALVGIYAISNIAELKKSLNYLIDNNVKTRGEYQLTDALQHMLKNGCEFTTASITEWLDCGTPEILLESNRYLLDTLPAAEKEEDEEEEKPLEERFPDCEFEFPCFVGSQTELSNCRIGPFASIGKNCKIKGTAVENSIIANGSTLLNSSVRNSILGENTLINNFSGSLYTGNSCVINPS
ncbi:MAG: NTP transferase domain-containing protein [Fibromonadaceae bacterium]|jgi:glucose-1-phosphate thymidylyltransferase|nr:NTP transferase domain-containing protein [Fibromonadaceae bacterium]